MTFALSWLYDLTITYTYTDDIFLYVPLWLYWTPVILPPPVDAQIGRACKPRVQDVDAAQGV